MTYQTDCGVDFVDRCLDVDSSFGAEYTRQPCVKLKAGSMESLNKSSRKL
jgi:hypothetical protein